MKRLGPELKMPELKPPAFLADVYWDLRERRLLPLVALIAVAIFAVPFLLGGDAETPVEVAPPVAAEEAVGGASANASLAVVEATPGLRDYEKRLKRQSPSDPFRQQYATPPGGGSGSGAGGGGGGSGSGDGSSIPSSSAAVEGDGGTSPGGGSSGGSSGDSGGGSSGGGSSGGGVRLIEFRFTIQISHSEETANGGQKMSEPQVRRRVPTLAQLPGKKIAVVTVGGVDFHNGKIFFLVSDDVRSLDGDFTCKTRTRKGLCELLEIAPGFPLEALYGPEKVRYRFKVTKVDAVWAGRPGDGGASASARAAEYRIFQNFN